MKFGQTYEGQRFTYDGIEYERIPLQAPRLYGFVNAKKTDPVTDTHYQGDLGYRHFYDDEEIAPVSQD